MREERVLGGRAEVGWQMKWQVGQFGLKKTARGTAFRYEPVGGGEGGSAARRV